MFKIKDSSGKYISPSGLNKDASLAIIFTPEKLRTRLGLPVGATMQTVNEKLIKFGWEIENQVEEKWFVLESKIDYNPDKDILFCEAAYYFPDCIVSDKVVYTPKRGLVRLPKSYKRKPDKVVFTAVKVIGFVYD